MKSLHEVKQDLREKEEIELIDLLDINSEEIVDRFDDKVENYWEEEFEDDWEIEDEFFNDDIE
jgi:hypothetical protein